jgi:hypothetical protein
MRDSTKDRKGEKNHFEKNLEFWTFRGKPTMDPSGGRGVNIMAVSNFMAAYLKIGVDYEFDTVVDI